MGERGRIEKHPWTPFEQLARVPFFALGFGVPAGQAVDHPVALVDIAPTLLAAAGVEPSGDLDGAPLQPYLESPTTGSDRSVYCYGINDFDMVRRRGYKYFRSHDSAAEMLFDLSRDPGELRNLAGDATLASVRKELAAEMDAVFSKPPPALPRFG